MTKNKWLKEEIDFLIKNYESLGVTKISNMLINHTYKSIVKKSQRLGLKVDKSIYHFDIDKLKKIVKESNSFADVLRSLNKSVSGDSYKVLKNTIEKYKIDTYHFDPYKNNRISIEPISIDNWLQNGTSITSSKLKDKLYKRGLKERKCELCGQDENWKGRKISLILDHINGINDDNRLENLQIVCPNCNAALDTFSGKNIKIKNNNYFVRENNYDLIRNNKNEVNKKIKICECGKQIHNSSNKCIECNNISQRRVKNRPSKEELILMVKESSLESVGRKYGVTGNSVKKWLKK